MKRRTTALTQCFDVKEIMSFFSTCFDNSIFNLGNPESYSFWAFIYTEKGDLTFKIGEKLYDVHDGEIIFYPANIPHTILSYKKRDWKVCFTTFTCESERMEFFENKIFTPDQRLSERISELFSFGRGFFRNPDSRDEVRGMFCDADEKALFKIKSELEGILTDLYTEPQKTAERSASLFNSAVRYMKEHLGEQISLSELAAELCVSVSTLKKAFQKECGGGVTKYYIDMKLHTAKELLCESELSVGEISEKLGFSSQFYFSELFKSRYSLSPTEYRKRQSVANANLI